jgi:formylglycine-generating enzyme required for sulfatase activity
MNDQARQALLTLRGSELTRSKLKEILTERCPQNRREQSALLAAYDQGIGQELAGIASCADPLALLARLTRRLEDDACLNHEAAKWAVESFALFCGMMDAPLVPFVAALPAAEELKEPLADNGIPAGFRAAAVTDAIIHEKTGMEFCFIPAGSFMMGSPDGQAEKGQDQSPAAEEPGRDSDELQHEVKITKPFYLGKYEVTQAQWQRVMGSNPSRFKGSDRPVEHVSWDDCQAFCEKLCRLGGLPSGSFRLPTEAEWEYACRARTTGAYAGTGNLDEMGWHAGAGMESKESKPEAVAGKADEMGWYTGETTRPVGLKQPNAWGLHDMHGNVWEWCQDWYDNYSDGPATDPTGPLSWNKRVVRGGSWGSPASSCRSAYRFRYLPGFRYCLVGFRVAFVAMD